MNRSRTRVAVVLTTLAAIALPGVAQASDNQLSIMMDDDLLVYRDDNTRDATLRQMKSAGVDYVRVTLLWSVVADKARSTKARDKRYRRLKGSSPKAYPMLNWDRYDRLVRAGQTLGVGIYFNITGPGPAWGHKTPPKSQRRNRKTWKPKAREFYKFVQAAGKRYSGRYRDENDGRRLIPRVNFWSLWNEPNQGGWLTPQYEKGIPASPHLYRELYIFGRRALESTGHGRDVILVGETAPIGLDRTDSRAPIRPKPFIREMFCLDANNVPYSGAAAAQRKCSDFQKYGALKATAWAHHPYTKKSSPAVKDPNPDVITMANIDDLGALLDGIAATTGFVAPNMPIVSSEFGYETSPPDAYQGIDYNTQAIWMNLGDLIAFQNPRVIGQTQFLFRDVAPLRKHKTGSKAYWSTYQSGILDLRGQPKPAYTAYTFPFLTYPTGTTSPEGRPNWGVWGQLKFRPNDLPPEIYDTVQLQFLPADGSSDWVNVGDPITVANGKGFFLATIAAPAPGLLRARWQGGAPPFALASREFTIG
jgi:hypothetical protein